MTKLGRERKLCGSPIAMHGGSWFFLSGGDHISIIGSVVSLTVVLLFGGSVFWLGVVGFVVVVVLREKMDLQQVIPFFHADV